MRWAGYVASIRGRKGVVYRVWWGNLGKRPRGIPRLNRRVILRRNFRKWDGATDWIDMV
jgi:hypothetical protein